MAEYAYCGKDSNSCKHRTITRGRCLHRSYCIYKVMRDDAAVASDMSQVVDDAMLAVKRQRGRILVGQRIKY